MYFIKIFTLIFLFISCSCLNKTTNEEKEINIGQPSSKIDLKVDGNSLFSYINTKLLGDTSRNLITQLGKYKFSTSKDPVNS